MPPSDASVQRLLGGRGAGHREVAGLSTRMGGFAPCLGLRETAEAQTQASQQQHLDIRAAREPSRKTDKTPESRTRASGQNPICPLPAHPNCTTHWEPPFSGVQAMQRTGSLDSAVEMPSARIRLDPQTTEAIACRVVELLEKRGLQNRELVDAAELARQFGIERSWVYTHAIELGAVKLGNGAKPRLRFDPEIAARVLRKVDGKPAADPPARLGKRASQPRGSEGRVELLPIREQGENSPPSAA